MKHPGLAAAPIAWLVAIAALGCGKSKTDTTPTEPDPPSSVAPAAPVALAPAARADHAGGEWNAAQIDWQTYAVGVAQAAQLGKPVCLVIHTAWCPHCRNFSHVFDDPRVVARARDFVMVHLDADANEDVARKFTPDGGYIPRTFFLSSDGQLDRSIHASRDRYQYFYDEADPTSLLGGMTAAVGKLHR